MNLQSRLQYKTAKLKRKLFDNAIRKKSLDVRAIRLTIEEDKYNNKNITVHDSGIVDIIISIPGGDLQAFNGERSNNATYNDGISIYSLLPIEAWSTNDAQLNKDDLLIYKYFLSPYNSDVAPQVKIQVFQVANKLSRMNNTVLYSKLILAPYNFDVDEYPEVKALIEEFQLEPVEVDL